MRAKLRWPLIAATVVVLLVAGCSSDDDDDGSTTTTAADTTTSAADGEEGEAASVESIAEEIGGTVLVLAGEFDDSPRNSEYVDEASQEYTDQGVKVTYDSSTLESDGSVEVENSAGDKACLTLPDSIDGTSSVASGACS